MMRMAGRGEDGKAKPLKTTNSGELYVNPLGRDKITRRLSFGEEDTKTITTQEPVLTDRITCQYLKNREIYVVISSNERPSVPVGVRIRGTVGNRLLNFSAYDWTRDSWMVSSFGDGSASGQMYAELEAVQPTQGFMLSTHPNFYWLKDFGGNSIQVELVALEPIPETMELKVDVYLVGEPI